MIFLDSSDPKEIKDISAWGILSGITTNPLIIAKEGGNVDLETRIKEVVEVSRGDVSVELTTETEKAMLDEAAKYHAWNPKRICIKVPFGEIGLRVLHSLATRGGHIITVPPAILRKMLWNPRTDETIREFNTAWANRGK